MSTRAYSLLEVKAIDEGDRLITGLASSPEVDRMGDIVEPLGIRFKNPIPLLLYHDQRLPVGLVEFSAPTKAGLHFRARLPVIDEPGPLRERVSEAWQLMKTGLIRGVSIGFKALENGVELLKSGGRRYHATEVLELSLVAVPALAAASIDAIKAADLAALGPTPPGDTGTPKPASPRRASPMITIAERKTRWTAERAAKVARQAELMAPGKDGAEPTLETKAAEEFDTLESEIGEIDKQLSRLEVLERHSKATAAPVTGADPVTAAAARDPKAPASAPVITVRSPLPPGMGFARVVLCRVASYFAVQRGEMKSAIDIARERYPDDHRVHLALTTRAAVPAATTDVPAWAGVLTDPANLGSEFLEYARPQTIVGRFGTDGIPALHEVPPGVPLVGQTAGGSAYWVGEGKPKPLTKFAYAATKVPFAKVASIAVFSEELARYSSPSAESVIRAGLTAAVIERIDIDFIDPAKAAVAGISPASVTNGVTPISSTGNDAASVRADIAALISSFVAANKNPSKAVLILPASLALNLSIMVSDLGQAEFPTVSMSGGKLMGIPVIVSQYASFAPPPAPGVGNLVIIVNADEILLTGDKSVAVDVSREAALEMVDAPTQDGKAGTGAALVSLWQNNLVGVRAEQSINWAKASPTAVAYLEDVNWGAATP